jgi:putative FmdB family regulatory protein
MPIYEYRCNDCGFEKDALQKMSDPPLVDCPQCGKPALKKLVSAAGFQLKGSGWYATDFKNSGSSKPAPKADAAKADASKGNAAEGGSSAPAESGASSDSKAETKRDNSPDSKSESKTTSTKPDTAKPSTPSTGTSG